VPWQVRAEVSLADLVEQAGSPKVFYSQPEQRDSLIALLAESGEARVQDLLCHLDTPWAIHFEVIRRVLESIGDPARQAVIQELSQNGDTHYASLLLAVFEKLGQPGDEPILGRYMNSGQRSLIIPAALPGGIRQIRTVEPAAYTVPSRQFSTRASGGCLGPGQNLHARFRKTTESGNGRKNPVSS